MAMPKVEPSPLRLFFSLTAEQLNGDHYIDLSQCATAVGRRFVSQGLNWAVAGFTLITADQATMIYSKMHNTWVTGASWEKTMEHWKEQQDAALAAMGGSEMKGRYNDYKVHMDTAHVAAGFGANLLPSSTVDAFTSGEWEASQVVIPNDGAPGTTTEYFVKMYGTSDAAAKSILGGYSFSRNLPFSPDPASPATPQASWLNKMMDVGDNSDDIVENATDRNNETPYNRAIYPGQAGNGDGPAFHDQVFGTATTISNRLRSMGGTFPCGLIKLTGSGFVSQSYLIIDLVPGEEKGYLTQKMAEMN